MPMSAENFAEIDAIKIKEPMKVDQFSEKHFLDKATIQSGESND